MPRCSGFVPCRLGPTHHRHRSRTALIHSRSATLRVPCLLDRLVLEGVVVTIDAIDCQKAIVQDLRADDDYVLAVKHHQPTLPCTRRCAQPLKMPSGAPARCWAVPASASGVAAPDKWSSLCNLIRVQAERNGPRGRPRAVRHCTASLPVDAEALLERIRGHWR